MTANPVKPARYRPGKGPQEQSASEEESDEEPQEQQQRPANSTGRSATRHDTTKQATAALRDVKLAERRAQVAAAEAARLEAEQAALAAALAAVGDEFETEESDAVSSDGEQGTDSSAQSSEAESASSSDSEPRKPLMRPTFVRKDHRAAASAADEAAIAEQHAAEVAAEKEAARKEAATQMVQEQLEKQAAARAAGKKAWDESDDEAGGLETVDDTDGLDPEAERAAWTLRELKRVQRARAAVEEAEKEREERERRRALSPGARAREDKEHLAKQREEREGRGKAGFMQRYLHKGAFFQDDLKEKGLDKRDLMGSRFVDDPSGGGAGGAGGGGKELLPEYMQIRDMAKLGRKGRTKYRDLKTEDTGRWGAFDDRRGGRPGFAGMDVDDRFKPDRPDGRGREGPTGANATSVKDRRCEPAGHPREQRDSGDDGRPGSSRPGDGAGTDRYRGSHGGRRDRSYSRSRSPPPQQRRSYSRSPPRRKRSVSPYTNGDKRRRVA